MNILSIRFKQQTFDFVYVQHWGHWHFTLPILNIHILVVFRIQHIDKNITSMIVIEWKQQSSMKTTFTQTHEHLPPKHYIYVFKMYYMDVNTNTYSFLKCRKSFLCICIWKEVSIFVVVNLSFTRRYIFFLFLFCRSLFKIFIYKNVYDPGFLMCFVVRCV